MESITKKTYQEFKKELDKEFYTAANSFVRIGYLLRIAKDTNILHESGYASLNEFAKAEYNLTKDMVSRYIRINEKYSVGGYGETLQTRYESFGVAKLAEMLTLPDAIAEEITPEMTKEQIQEVRREVREEEKITDIEVALEDTEPLQENRNNIQKWMYQYFLQEKESFCRVKEAVWRVEQNTVWPEEKKAGMLLDALVPTGVGILTARVPGMGKLMLSIKSVKEDAVLINARNPEEKESIGWQQLAQEFKEIYDISVRIPESWEKVYGKPYEKKETKPEETVHESSGNVRKDSEIVNKDSENVRKTQKSAQESDCNVPVDEVGEKQKLNRQEETQAAAVTEENQPDTEVAPEQQLAGQMEIHNYCEVLPEGEKFVPAFGEWVSVDRKAVPDEEGRYLIFYISEQTGKGRKKIVGVMKNQETEKLEWETIDEVLYWMPLPEDPEEYRGE